jgi:hypothetical protein
LWFGAGPGKKVSKTLSQKQARKNKNKPVLLMPSEASPGKNVSPYLKNPSKKGGSVAPMAEHLQVQSPEFQP